MGVRFHEFLGVHLGLSPDLGLGATSDSLLRTGLLGTMGWHGDAVVRLLRRTGGTQLALRLGARGRFGLGVAPGPALDAIEAEVEALADGGGDDTLERSDVSDALSAMLSTGSRMEGRATLALAHPITPWAGFQTAFDGGFGAVRSSRSGAEALSVRMGTFGVGVVGTLDGVSRNVPIGFRLEYRADVEVWLGEGAPAPSHHHLLATGVYYTGSPVFVTGVVFSGPVGEVTLDEPTPFLGQIVVAVYPETRRTRPRRERREDWIPEEAQ